MKQKETKNSDLIRLLSIGAPLVYFAGYLTRKDYSIVMEAVIQNEQLSKNAAGLVETLSVISYGSGQIVSGFFGDRIKAHKMVFSGLAVSILINLMMPLAKADLRPLLWFINGFAQSMLWPPMLKILSTHMDRKDYENAAVNMNIAGIFATVLIYLSSSLLWIAVFQNWKLTFYANGTVAFLILLLWSYCCKKIEEADAVSYGDPKTTAEQKREDLQLKPFLLKSGFLLIALAIVLQGMLRDGISDWLPSFMANTFSLSSDQAIFKSVLLPLIGILSLRFTGFFNRRFVKEETRAAALFFAAATIICLLLNLSYANNEYLTILLSSLTVGTMHAVNLFLVSILPSHFARYGMVSTVSGIVNSLTYVGSAAAIYGFGLLSERFGWRACTFSWTLIAVFGSLSCLLAVSSWKRFKER
ncbi:MAG: MFS transporter [Erysipelotrichaceae bacterium]|nr:MFS transporter [Erysipelotrichaceae bacterium]